MPSCEDKYNESLSETQKLLQRLSLNAIEAIGNSIPAGIIVISDNERIVYTNDQAIQIFGFNPCGLSFKEYAINMAKARKLENGPYLYQQLPLIKALLYGKTTYSQEIIIEKSDKSQVILSVNATPLSDKDGNITGALAVFSDITDHKKAEEELQRVNKKLTTLYESIDDTVIAIDRNWDVSFANKRIDNYMKINASDLVGKNYWELFPKLLGTVIEENLRAAMDKREPRVYEAKGPYSGKWACVKVFPSATGITILASDITERKKAEAALKESEQLYRTLFDATEEGFQLFKPIYQGGKPCDLLVLRVNEAYERQTGLRASDIIGKTVREFIPDIEPYWISTYGNIAKTGKAVHIENYNQATHRWYDVYAFLYVKEQVGVLFRNITERKSAEQALQQSEERFFKTFNNNPAAMTLTRLPEGVWVDANESFLRLTGFSREEVIGHSSLELHLFVGDVGKRAQTIDLINKQKKVDNIEIDAQTKTGKPLKLLLSVVKTVIGNQELAITTQIDITERKNAEEALKRQAALIDLSPDAIIVRGFDGTITFWSKGAEKLYGWKSEEAVGKIVYKLLSTVFPKPLAEIEKDLCARHNWAGVLSHLGKDGRWIDVQSKWLLELSDNGESGSILETNMDLTDLRKVEAELRTKERLAAIGTTAGMVGHDIRNPLQAITGDVYLLKDYLSAMPEMPTKIDVAESLDSIEQNVSYIDKIVADLQDYAKLVTPQYADVNLYELVVKGFQQIVIPNDVSPSIEIDASFRFHTDPDLFRRILTNLVINALQAMPKGGDLKIKASAYKDKVTLVVQDTGAGIPDNVKAKLFTPMMTTKAKGQGLGLAVVKRLVEALKGTITFESEEGKGTKFIIELPSS